jgi:hypothetical protein
MLTGGYIEAPIGKFLSRWATKAAEAGHKTGLFMLATLYETGKPVRTRPCFLQSAGS